MTEVAPRTATRTVGRRLSRVRRTGAHVGPWATAGLVRRVLPASAPAVNRR